MGKIVSRFTPGHRAGDGPPMVCLHGFLDTWRVWDLVRPALERRHDVLALTLPGHAGGPPLPDHLDENTLADAVERAMDEAGMATAHLVGNSLGGHVALQLAARGRARSVVALAPVGGWRRGDAAGPREVLELQRGLQETVRARPPAGMPTSPGARRLATSLVTVAFEHIPPELLAHQAAGVAACPGAERMIDHALRHEWRLDAAQIACPVRVLWGAADRLLPWPRAAARYRDEWLPHADWVVLDDVGHCPQLDVPLETAQLILGHTAP